MGYILYEYWPINVSISQGKMPTEVVLVSVEFDSDSIGICPESYTAV